MENTFGKPIIPENEKERLAALHAYDIAGSSPERFFDNLAHIIAQSFDAPIALISLVDEDAVYFKANVGMPGTDVVPRGVSLCSLAVLDSHPTIFENALEEPCLLTNPLVAGEFGLRFYAGAPITTPEGFHIGTVCIVDKEPRVFSELEQELLKRFADSAMEAILKRQQLLKGVEDS
ncbi:GAF domain-containing protein [Flaviaesturariibacter amylovorans]|uniref:GAF domain-containing protein n=1 Tax=Flaviaesturariibacter amylovorans TaxID=1084520 RepID=A0ABP8HSP5_9BACT